MGRAPCCEKVGMKKGRWTAEEDQILSDYIRDNGEGSWRALPKNAGLKRCGKSCRLRWINYLRSDLKRGNITPEEENLIVRLHSTLGNRWSIIASNLPGRTDNEIKNYWNSHLSRKLHNFIGKSFVMNFVENAPPHPPLPKKRRPGRTSRSLMKPKFIQNPKNQKTPKSLKKNKNDVVLPISPRENGEGGKEEALNVLSSSKSSGAEEGPCSYEDVNTSINDDDGVLLFNDDIFDTCLLSDVFSFDSNNIKDSEPNREQDTMADDFVDWDFLLREGQDLLNGKEYLDDSVSSWLLDGDKRDSNDYGEPLDILDKENEMIAWLLS